MQQQIQKLNVKFNHFLRKNFPEIQRYDFEEIRKDIDEFIEVVENQNQLRADMSRAFCESIFSDSKINIMPLNILTFIGSLYLFHYNPGYYTIVNTRDPKLAPLLLLCDIIVHYIPLVVVYKVYNTTTINYPLCIAIILTYLLIFHSQLYNIYFNYERFISKYHS